MRHEARDRFKPGDRVRVRSDYHWAQGATGVIAAPIEEVGALTPDRIGSRRMVTTFCDAIVFYWVNFDEPQVDLDGDGPYRAAEIDGRYLEPVSDVFPFEKDGRC